VTDRRIESTGRLKAGPNLRARSAALGASALFAALALLVMAGCMREPGRKAEAAAPPPSQPSAVPGDAHFVGSAACRSCHPAEFRMHGASRHSVTLHSARRADLGRLMPPLGRVPGTDIVLSEQQGAIEMTLAGQPSDVLPIDLVFGSGKTGVTLVAFIGMEALELHKSYFPALRQWYLTPGHEKQKATDVGMMHKRDAARECVLCHAVTVREGSAKPEPQYFGVGCESCHGAGGAHVAAMRAGSRSNLSLERLGRLDATRLNDLCGRCHRGSQSLNLQTNQAKMSNRFQAYGLMKSRCFVDGGRSLSCITCHNPHTDAGTNPRPYEAVCLSCHSAAKRSAAVGGAVAGRVCPVNRATGCIGCHMPKRAVFVTNNVPTQMADHYIHVAAAKRGR
jgi:hypothetical protein